MKQQLKIYVLIILMISFLGCFGKSSPQNSDTAPENLELEYYIYLEGNPLPDSYFKKTIKVTHDRWKIEVTEKNLPPDSIEFVGTRKFILRLKATDPVHPAVFK